MQLIRYVYIFYVIVRRFINLWIFYFYKVTVESVQDNLWSICVCWRDIDTISEECLIILFAQFCTNLHCGKKNTDCIIGIPMMLCLNCNSIIDYISSNYLLSVACTIINSVLLQVIICIVIEGAICGYYLKHSFIQGQFSWQQIIHCYVWFKNWQTYNQARILW